MISIDIEMAMQRGDDTFSFDPEFFDAIVLFKDGPCRSQPTQKMQNSECGLLRVPVASVDASSCRAAVCRDAGSGAWRFCLPRGDGEQLVPGGKVKLVRLPARVVVDVASVAVRLQGGFESWTQPAPLAPPEADPNSPPTSVSPAVAAPPALPAPAGIMLALDRSTGRKFGVKFTTRATDVLVDEIYSGGLFAEHGIDAGDVIVDADGVSGSGQKIIDAMRANAKLIVTIRKALSSP